MNSNGKQLIEILPREDSSVTKKISLELGKYTILAGENNAGKTNLVKALMDVLPTEQTIYIPAESIVAEEHLKTTATGDPMREAFSKLIKVTVDQLPQINYDDVEEFLKKITATFDSFNVPNISLGLGVKKLDREKIEKIVKDEVSKKILNSTVKDNYGSGHNLKISAVGQGTQRLIIVSILQELSKARTQAEELFLIFEEPEIYLHPKLKRSLYEALVAISENNIKVIITTHDPYFIELGADQIIYNVFRDTNGATDIQLPSIRQVLDAPTYAETTYVIFDTPSTDYFLQLYQQVEEKGGVDFKTEKIDGISLSKIRASLAHKTASYGRSGEPQASVTEDLKKKAIDYLRGVLS